MYLFYYNVRKAAILDKTTSQASQNNAFKTEQKGKQNISNLKGLVE